MRGEAGISIGDNFAGSAIVWENMLDIEIGNGGGGGRFVAGNENSGFRTVVVCNGEDAIKTIGKWKFNDEIHGHGFEWKSGVVGGNGAVWDTGVRGIDFGGLAGGATLDE